MNPVRKGSFFLEPITSAAMQCLCCFRRRSKEVNMFYYISSASCTGSTINFLLYLFRKNNF